MLDNTEVTFTAYPQYDYLYYEYPYSNYYPYGYWYPYPDYRYWYYPYGYYYSPPIIYCPYCGKKLEADDETRCPVCGQRKDEPGLTTCPADSHYIHA